MRKLMNGGYYPWAPKSGAGYVDIDDVAAAHTLAMLNPQASGRCAIPNRPHCVSSHLATWNGLWFGPLLYSFDLQNMPLMICS